MAERRMFAKTIIDSDAFLDMPLSAQALYFHLSMRADDDGFINNPKKIQRMIGASDDDCKLLLAKKFLLSFESGVIVIKHWKIHNYIQKDRYKETLYKDEKQQLTLNENNAYTMLDTQCIHDVSMLDTQVRLGKDRLELGKDSICKPKKRFAAPTINEVAQYCKERQNGIDPQRFIDHYTSNGWKVGKSPMKDWKAAVRTWEKNEYSSKPKKPDNNCAAYDIDFAEQLINCD